MDVSALALGSISDLVSGEVWSAERLRQEVARRAASLAGLGVTAGKRVVVCRRKSPEFFADLLAVWRQGACASCASATLTAPELENLCEFTSAQVLLVDGEFNTGCHPPCPIVDNTERAKGVEAAPAGPGGSLDADALMLFTSGTTGRPKGVVHTFRSLFARIALNHAHIGASALRRTLCLLPAHFGHGLIGNSLTPLLNGHHLVLAGGVDLPTAHTLGRTLDEQEITFMSSVPALWKMVLRLSQPPQAGTLQQVHIGSSPLAADVWESVCQWSGTRRVLNMYGITEAANWIAGASAADFRPQDGLIGEAWGGCLAVLQPSGRIEPTGQGELVMLTPSLMRGYHRRSDLTRGAFAGGWYRSGDRGIIDEQGVARLTGRLKEEINRAGIKVQPAEVDLLLERHPAVQEACAFALPDDISGERVAVAVRVEEGLPTPEELEAWCRSRIRPEAVPERWFFVDRIVKTDRGKVNRERVREQCLKPPS